MMRQPRLYGALLLERGPVLVMLACVALTVQARHTESIEEIEQHCKSCRGEVIMLQAGYDDVQISNDDFAIRILYHASVTMQ
jgi:hypothetical protein